MGEAPQCRAVGTHGEGDGLPMGEGEHVGDGLPHGGLPTGEHVHGERPHDEHVHGSLTAAGEDGSRAEARFVMELVDAKPW